MTDDQRLTAGAMKPQRIRVTDDAPSTGDPALIASIDAHISRHIGPVEAVYHEHRSPYVHLDVHHVPPTARRPYHVLVTSGMSEMPMTTPPEADPFRYAELMVCLPKHWPITEAALQHDRHGWPVRWLKMLARMPHEYATWLAYGHTVPNGEPPEPLSGETSLCGVLLVPPVSLPTASHQLRIDAERTIHFWTLLPLHAAELTLTLAGGMEALLPLLDAHGVTEIVDLARPSVA